MGDPIEKVFLIITIVLGSVLALRPDWFIWAASYGRRGLADVGATRLRIVRIIAGVTAISCLIELAWPHL